MPYVIPERRVAGLILCSLAAGVLILAGCRKATFPPPPPRPSFETGSAAARLPGKIEGQIRDGQGAVMPLVEVTVASAATRQIWTVIADEDGKYSFPNLRPGAYTVQGAMNGFKIATRSGVQVISDETVRIDLTLHVGEVTDIEFPVGRYYEPARAERGRSGRVGGDGAAEGAR